MLRVIRCGKQLCGKSWAMLRTHWCTVRPHVVPPNLSRASSCWCVLRSNRRLLLLPVHRRGIIHRDIKPDNILLQSNGVSKVRGGGLLGRLPVMLWFTSRAGAAVRLWRGTSIPGGSTGARVTHQDGRHTRFPRT